MMGLVVVWFRASPCELASLVRVPLREAKGENRSSIPLRWERVEVRGFLAAAYS